MDTYRIGMMPGDIIWTREELRSFFPEDPDEEKMMLEYLSVEAVESKYRPYWRRTPFRYPFLPRLTAEVAGFLSVVSDPKVVNARKIGVCYHYPYVYRRFDMMVDKIREAVPYVLPKLNGFVIETVIFWRDSSPEEIAMAWAILSEAVGFRHWGC